jgi:3-deoxy-D-manno-octulosonic-acid transferase
VPVIRANGRLTERSTRQYRIFRSGLRPLFSVYRRFVMQSKADSERIIAIGADPTRVVELGNIKHDTNGPVDREAKRRDVRRFLRLPDDRLFFVAASTRPGEEKIICEAVKENSSFPGRMTVMVAPRHLERLDEVAALLNDCQIEFTRYTTLEAGAMLSTPVVLMDKIGVLADLFYGADLAFVGGTLVDLGGHNIMEPVLAGTPVLFGPSVHNVREAADRIIAADQGMMVSTGDDLARVLEEFAAGRLHFKTMQAGKPSVADQTAHIIVTELGL